MMWPLILAAAAAAQVTPTQPIDLPSWFSSDDYPADALKQGIEGSVRFYAHVDAQGKPTACEIMKSSGSRSLDDQTCKLVMERGKFHPAMRQGKPVPDTYSRTTTWRLATMPSNSYRALIFDFKDPQHPGCTLVEKDMPSGPTCEEALKHYDAEATAGMASLAVLMTITVGDEKPYAGDPAWGKRTDFSAVDLFAAKGVSGRPACVVVARQGLPETLDLCAQYPDGSKLSDAEKKSAIRMHQEQSRFVIMKDGSEPRRGKCKDGESQSEAAGCV